MSSFKKEFWLLQVHQYLHSMQTRTFSHPSQARAQSLYAHTARLHFWQCESSPNRPVDTVIRGFESCTPFGTRQTLVAWQECPTVDMSFEPCEFFLSLFVVLLESLPSPCARGQEIAGICFPMCLVGSASRIFVRSCFGIGTFRRTWDRARLFLLAVLVVDFVSPFPKRKGKGLEKEGWLHVFAEKNVEIWIYVILDFDSTSS